jgi:hypothetical protein
MWIERGVATTTKIGLPEVTKNPTNPPNILGAKSSLTRS